MSKWWQIGIICLVLAGMVIRPDWLVLAHEPMKEIGQSSDELDQKLENTQKQIDELEAKLAEVEATAKNLKQQIAYMDGQIQLTELRVLQLEKEIVDLKNDIEDLGVKIESLDVNLDQMAVLLASRVQETYKIGRANSLTLFLGSETFGDLANKVRSIQQVQLNDRQLLLAMQKTKSSFEQQKTVKEAKQVELDTAQAKLEKQKALLDQQKVSKQVLLDATKNDQKRFEELLSAARAEQAAIQAAISSLVKNLKNGTRVEAGEKIAIMGNSGAEGGCSTAAHLHFEVTNKEGVNTNPAQYLKSDWPYTWDLAPDAPFALTGSWDWPMRNPRITQAYGNTWWARSGFYGGKPHTGIDMVDRDDTTIRAPRAGTLYKGAASCRGKPMNYVAVEHDDVISWYWHVQ